MKKKLTLIMLMIAMVSTAYVTFKALEDNDDIFAVSFDEDEDADF